MRLIDADALMEKVWDADTRIGYVQVVDVGDILDAPTVELEQKGGKEMDDLISRQAAIEAICEEGVRLERNGMVAMCEIKQWCIDLLDRLPSAQPEQRYTKEELMVFRHGISLSLLSKRSAQHWRYDEDTATEIEFLERLYEKVGADIRGEEK